MSACWHCGRDDDELKHATAELEHMTKLHAQAERAMHSAYEASQAFEALAQKYFDAKEPLECVADAARDLIKRIDEGGCYAIDDVCRQIDGLRRALVNSPVDPEVAALMERGEASS